MRYLCIALCRKGKWNLKLNKLNPQTNEKKKTNHQWLVGDGWVSNSNVMQDVWLRAVEVFFLLGCHDSWLPWDKALELGSSVARVGSDSPSSELPDASGSMALQLALFRPKWPSMVWESRVSEKRAHSANRGSTTYVMKPGTRKTESEVDITRSARP